jgi:ribosome-associated protein
MPDALDVPIRDEVIRLGQFLKLANLIEHGADAKAVVQQGLVSVNGEVETRRGRQLVVGDVVSLAGLSARVGDGSVEPQDGASDGLPW